MISFFIIEDIHPNSPFVGEKEIINEALLNTLEEHQKNLLILSLTDETIIRGSLSRYFNSVFNNQIKNQKHVTELNIKGRLIGLFLNNRCEDFKKTVNYKSQAI